MSRWLSLAEDGEKETHTPPDSMTKPDINPPAVVGGSASQPKGAFCQVLSNCQVEVEKHQSPPAILEFTPPQLPPEVDEMRHGFAEGGRPKTWAGRVVSLDDWRSLSPWDRHGPDGRVWNGKTRRWEDPA